MTKEIREYFNGFGDLDFVQFHLQEGSQHGFVQFKETKCAKAVLSNETHSISNCHLTVSAANDCHQPDFKQENWTLPPQQNSLSHIFIALNDDCLREVFLRLKLLDLCKAAEVSVRFNQLAKQTFAAKFKHLNLSVETLEVTFFFNDELLLQLPKILLSNFGSLIQSLRVDGSITGAIFFPERSYNFLHMIGQYCTSNLNELELEYFEMKRNFPDELFQIFAKLQRLSLKYCKFSNNVKNFKSLLSTCNELKMMIIYSCRCDWECITRKFPNLEDIYLNENHGFNISNLSNFIVLNPTITKLSFNDGDIEASEVFRLISQNLPNLTELDLDCVDCAEFQDKIRCLGQLRSLNMLSMDFKSNRIAPLMASLVMNKVPIQSMRLCDGKVDVETIDLISQLKQIKNLDFVKVIDMVSENLIELAKQLPQIERFILFDTPIKITTTTLKKMIAYACNLSQLYLKETELIGAIDIDDYKTMLKSVQNRTKFVDIWLLHCSHVSQIIVPSEVLNENQDFIGIKERLKEVIEVVPNENDDTDYDDLSGGFDLDYDDDMIE